MKNEWYISDTHFGHFNSIFQNKRPWTTLEEMEEALIANWNSVVKPQDRVRILGDMFMKCGVNKTIEIISRLNGIKDLYLGNHDMPIIKDHKDKSLKVILTAAQKFGLNEVYNNGAIHIPGFDDLVLLSHFPYLDEDDSHHYEQVNGRLIEKPGQRFSEFRLPNTGKWLFHGHVHRYWKQKNKMINVGVDVWDFFPVHTDQLLELIRRV